MSRAAPIRLLPCVLAAAGLFGPALSARAGPEKPLGKQNVTIDPHTRFPSGTATGDNNLADHVGGRLSPSTMRDHPATASITTGWGGTTTPPSAGQVGGTGRAAPAPSTSPSPN